MTILHENDEYGRSMVEMLGVLAIIGVLSVGGIAGYSKAMTKFKINKSMDQISMLVASIRTLYSGQRNYAGFNNENAISFGIVPNEMVGGDDTITNAFAGSVIFGTSTQNGNVSAAFTITYNGLGKEACVTMATADWGSGSSSGMVSMSVAPGAAAGGGGGDAEGGGEAPAGGGAGKYTGAQLPVSLDNAAGKCGCDEPTCSITWEYL